MISGWSAGMSRVVMDDVAPLSVCSASRVEARMSQRRILASKPAGVSVLFKKDREGREGLCEWAWTELLRYNFS
jgi:hypothetical protein